MSMKKSTLFLTVFTLFGSISCQLQKQKAQGLPKTPGPSNASIQTPLPSGSQITGPAVIVYKTRNNYNDLVPVELSADKTRILSYPDPKDVRSRPGPTVLDNGYLLDHRGIGKNVAFLKITYEAYAKLTETPPLDSLQAWILDKNPLLEIYDCGRRYHDTNLKAELNTLIQSGQLRQTCHSMN
ncbi:MAG TPA: hypothetical protein VFL76_03615 [Edaphocola sp.]|nr:hypothetical protein [Edaphocola sp.]